MTEVSLATDQAHRMGDDSTRDARRLRAPATEVQRARTGKRCALVVGINRYGEPDHRFKDLKNAVNDANAIASRLAVEFGFSVTLLIDEQATASGVQQVLARWRDEVQPEDDLLIFFAGHGANPQGQGRQSEGYLVPFGADRNPDTWLSEADIIRYAEESRSQRVFLLFDACYAGAALRAHDGIRPGQRVDQVIKILVAGTEDQPVLDGGATEHSIFTKAILDGLDGLADVGLEPDGAVSAHELILFAQSEVAWRSRVRKSRQTPVGGTLARTPGPDDFEFRPSKPRLPASLLRNLYSHNKEDREAAVEQLKALKGTSRAWLAAKELLDVIHNVRMHQGEETLGGTELVEVRIAAVNSLSALGHTDGFEPLCDLLDTADEKRELRIAAASALGVLVETAAELGVSDAADHRQKAIAALIARLTDDDVELREAAKDGLSHVPDSARTLAQRLDDKPSRPEQFELVDALACIAKAQPKASGVWPSLGARRYGLRLLRRVYLARRRLAPALPTLLSHAATLSVFGAVGLGLAYLSVAMVAFKPLIKLYAPAVLTISALPGALCGLAFVAVPHLTRATSRFEDAVPTVVGSLVAGLSLSLAMAVPNWFLAIGCGSEGCPPDIWLFWLLPGLIIGPILGFALVFLPHQAAGASIRNRPGLWRRIAPMWDAALANVSLALISGLAFAVTRIPPPLSTGRVDPYWKEVVAWGFGGFLFGFALALGFGLIPSSGNSWTMTFKDIASFLSGRWGSDEARSGGVVR
jgi:uncharacterized caspase-like protein